MDMNEILTGLDLYRAIAEAKGWVNIDEPPYQDNQFIQYGNDLNILRVLP